jgi:GNAT superfamily N-acetyltransferase
MTPGVGVPAGGPGAVSDRVHVAVGRALYALIALGLATNEQGLLPVLSLLADAAEEARCARLRDTESALADAIGHLVKAETDEARSAVIAARSTLVGRSRQALCRPAGCHGASVRLHHVVLEMTAPGRLRPSRPVEGVTLRPLPAASDLLGGMRARVGAPYRWSAVEWSERRFQHDTAHWLTYVDDDAAGLLTLHAEPSGDVEIDTFGLAPEYVGCGYGGYALTLAIEAAWTFTTGEAARVRRVWLHASTTDHPHALSNYEHRGFRPFRGVHPTHQPD